MTKFPLISVVIAAYNEEENLSKCLESIINQDFPRQDYEIIVVDNNSTDKTVEIARKYGANVIEEKRQGNTYAISKGMNAAKGEVIAALDADSNAKSNWLAQIADAFQDENVVAATGNVEFESGSSFLDWIGPKLYGAFLRFNFTIGKPHLTGFNLIVRRRPFVDVGGIDEKFTMSSDVDLGLRIAQKGKILYLKDLKVHTSFRRWHDNPWKTFKTYFAGYIYTVWLRKPSPLMQNPIR